MTDDKGGRQLTPREPGEVETTGGEVTPVKEGDSRGVERFRAAPSAHTVGLTEERGAQIVRQSGNARNIVFLALLVIAIFVPVYWFYEAGIPALGAPGRMEAEVDVQYVTDVARGYELFLANCARCHGENGQGGIGPPLNSQPKLYNALTADGQSGTGHLNPDYIHNVLNVGGRYVCGDPNSLMLAWQEPRGPLNYRQVEELIAWITASKDIVFEPIGDPHAVAAPDAPKPSPVSGWRDPLWTPAPGATPPPACWKAPDGLVPETGGSPSGTPLPIEPGASLPPDSIATEPPTGGTPDNPRQIMIEATSSLTFVDENGDQLTQLDLKAGETVEFVVDNTAGFDHDFYIGSQDALTQGNAETEVGIPAWTSGTQTLTWTVAAGDQPLQFACTIPGHYTTMHGDIVIQS